MDFGILWKLQGFGTAKDTPIKNGKIVAELLDAMLLPRELALVKVKAHTKMDTHSQMRYPEQPQDKEREGETEPKTRMAIV